LERKCTILTNELTQERNKNRKLEENVNEMNQFLYKMRENYRKLNRKFHEKLDEVTLNSKTISRLEKLTNNLKEIEEKKDQYLYQVYKLHERNIQLQSQLETFQLSNFNQIVTFHS